MKKDKVLHLLAGIFWTLLCLTLGFDTLTVLVIIFVLAISKELLDKLGGGVCDCMDFVTTMAGFPTGLLLLGLLLLALG